AVPRERHRPIVSLLTVRMATGARHAAGALARVGTVLAAVPPAFSDDALGVTTTSRVRAVHECLPGAHLPHRDMCKRRAGYGLPRDTLAYTLRHARSGGDGLRADAGARRADLAVRDRRGSLSHEPAARGAGQAPRTRSG